MENNSIPTLTVMEQPKLGDQVVSAAVGSLVSIAATVALSAGSSLVKSMLDKREAKKLAKEATENLKED